MREEQRQMQTEVRKRCMILRFYEDRYAQQALQ